MFDIAGTVELGKICPGTGTWNRLQDGITGRKAHAQNHRGVYSCIHAWKSTYQSILR